MDGANLIFIVMPIVIPLVLFVGIALPYLADSRSGRKDRDMHTTFAARQGSGPAAGNELTGSTTTGHLARNITLAARNDGGSESPGAPGV